MRRQARKPAGFIVSSAEEERMLTAEAAGLVLSVARGLVKLGGRFDLLMAERTVVQADLRLPMPKVAGGPPAFVKVQRLRDFVAQSEGAVPDPLAPDRARLVELLAMNPPGDVNVFFRRLFPLEADPPEIDPDQEYVKVLRRRLPSLPLDDSDTLHAVFYVDPGRDARELGYVARTALLVVDVVAEIGVENAGLIHGATTRTIVQSVLERFARPELETFTEWSPVLRHVLGATLNGVLDSRESLDGAGPWVGALLTALAAAREDSGAGDDYVVGLVRGRGYRILLSKGLLVAAERLNAADAKSYEKVLVDILVGAAPLVKQSTGGFDDFFEQNWGELVRAGFISLEAHGPSLLEGAAPLLRDTTLSLIGVLAKTPSAQLLQADTLYRLADAAIGTIAANEDLLKGAVREAWLQELVAAVAKTAADQGIRKAFTREGLEEVLRSALRAFALHPELIVQGPAARVELVAAVLKGVASAGNLDAKTLASAAVASLFEHLASHPGLRDSDYGPVVADLAGQVAKLVTARTLTGIQGADLITAAAGAIMRNPELFGKVEDKIASTVLAGVVKGTRGDKTGLLAGAALVDLVTEIFLTLSRRGRDLIANSTQKELAAKLSETVAAGLARAEKEIGRRLDLPALPAVLAGLVAAVARGELADIDPENGKFKEVFAQLAEALGSVH